MSWLNCCVTYDYAQAGQRLILLLVGGDKRKQQADIEQAHRYWMDWQHRRKLK